MDPDLWRWYERKNKARVTVGVLSFLTGGFFVLSALFFWSMGGRVVGNRPPPPYLLELVLPLIVVGVALLIVTLIAVLIPIKAPRFHTLDHSMGWRMDRGMAWRIALLVVLLFGLIVFINIWFFFFEVGFYHNTIFIAVLLVFVGAGAAVWASMWLRW